MYRYRFRADWDLHRVWNVDRTFCMRCAQCEEVWGRELKVGRTSCGTDPLWVVSGYGGGGVETVVHR